MKIEILALLLVTASSVNADPCASVQREMTFGEMALERANSKEDYLKSAKQFEAAIAKAPGCAAAHFNRGLVLEKAEQYPQAHSSLSRYLELSPRAGDAAAVQKRLYQLDYLIQEAEAGSTWQELEGRWCQVNFCGNGDRSYDVAIDGNQITISMRTRHITTSTGCKISSRNEWVGSLSNDGSINGRYRNGDYRYEERCVAGYLPANQWNWKEYDFSGHVDGELINTQWEEHYSSGSDNVNFTFRRY